MAQAPEPSIAPQTVREDNNVVPGHSEVRPKRPLRIIMTVNAAWNIWNFRRPLLSALLADGHEVTVLAPDDEFAAKLTGLGARFIPLPMQLKSVNPASHVALAWRMRRAFAKIQPDIVLSYTIKNNIYGAFAARSLGQRFIPNVTGLGTAFLSGGILQSLAQLLYRSAFAGLPVVFFQNEDDRDLFLGKGLLEPRQARLLPGSGIDLAHFAASPYPPAKNPPIFLMIARLLRQKGVEEFVEAARLVRKQYPAVRFQLLGAAGTANRSAISLDTVQAWENTHGIEYLGTCQDVRAQIAEANCVVLPSYREGAPRTLIEAAAMGRPVIATDVPGCRSVVANGTGGLLCPPRDAGGLAAACVRFLELDQAEREAMGQAGRAKMEREFDQELIARAYREVIGQAMAAAPGA